MDSWSERLDLAVNVALLCAFVAVAALAAQRFIGAHPSSHPAIGTRISLPGIEWSKSNQNLVLALSTTCHFCTDNADFYKRLVAAADSRKIPIVAVLPQPLAASQPYLEGLGVSVGKILQNPLDSIDVTGTPTVLEVDAKGKVQKAWVGKVSDQQEREVIGTLH